MRTTAIITMLCGACGGQATEGPRAPSPQRVAPTRTTTDATAPKPSEAFTLIRGSELEAAATSCDGGDRKSCVTLALALAPSTDRRPAFDLLVRTCDAGGLLACAHVGGYYLDGGPGELVTIDRPRGLALVERACTAGVRVGCYKLAEALMDDQDYDRARARALLDKACGSEDDFAIDACVELSKLLQTRRLGPPDVEAATAVLERACSSNATICAALCHPDQRPASTPARITATASPVPNVAACKAEQRLRRR